MKAPLLKTDNFAVRLIEPNIERDAELGVIWLNGESGHATMLSMGNNEEAIKAILPTTLEKESERVKDFIENKSQLNWMIEYRGRVVGSVWVDLHDSKDLPGPSVHIMIGDTTMRGKRVGTSSIKSVIEYLMQHGNEIIYSRHLISNKTIDSLLKSLGFIDFGESYVSDSLKFQNLIYKKQN